MTNQIVNVTELDFDSIKKNLIEYFSAEDSPYRDWNYNGSSLNTLLDLLAYNTHYNAILAHMAINETFIDSAQLRSNVVSAAKLIGYVPKSYTAPSASIDISVPVSGNANSSTLLETYTIPFGSVFSNQLASTGYEFTNLDDINLILNKETLIYETESPVTIYQGEYKTVRTQINHLQSNNEYLIVDKNIDIATLRVLIYPNNSTNTAELYTKFNTVNNIDSESPIYFISENYNGNYVINFGNGIFGKKPTNLHILELQYLVTSGADSNGANQFAYNGRLYSDGKIAFNTSELLNAVVNTVSPANGGSSNETISAIKFNAPLRYIAQNRAVTADDYKTLINDIYPEAKSISVWGGEDHEPPQYGKVFISIKPNKSASDVNLTNFQKINILDGLKSKKVLSIIPEIVDAEYINIVLDVLFKYNKNLTKLTKTQLENEIKNTIVNFNDNNLEAFDGVFRHSLLNRIVDNYSPAILNSLIRVFVSKDVVLDPNNQQTITLKYGTSLVVDDDAAITYSSSWNDSGRVVYFGDEATDDPNIRSLYTYYNNNSLQKVVLNDLAGFIDLNAGTVEINPITLDEITTVNLDLIPLSNDIAPKRNQLIRIDTNRLNIIGDLDIISSGGSGQLVNYSTFSRDR
jgi:hypothetical protein